MEFSFTPAVAMQRYLPVLLSVTKLVIVSSESLLLIVLMFTFSGSLPGGNSYSQCIIATTSVEQFRVKFCPGCSSTCCGCITGTGEGGGSRIVGVGLGRIDGGGDVGGTGGGTGEIM